MSLEAGIGSGMVHWTDYWRNGCSMDIIRWLKCTNGGMKFVIATLYNAEMESVEH